MVVSQHTPMESEYQINFVDILVYQYRYRANIVNGMYDDSESEDEDAGEDVSGNELKASYTKDGKAMAVFHVK